MDKIRVFEAFAGIGTQRMALKNIGVSHEVIGISEIDKHAIESYMAIHGETRNFGDISKIDGKEIPDHDLFTYSFPCQDISIAGKQNGLEEGSGTRSSLLWECNRIIENKKPKYLLMENVKNLVGKKHKPDFDRWLDHLSKLGYNNHWAVLNSKDFGVPQNRDRVFCVSVLQENDEFLFPNGVILDKTIEDILEDNPSSSLFLKKVNLPYMKKNYIQYDNSGKGYCSQTNRLYYKDGVMGTLPSSNGGYKTQICDTKKEDNIININNARRLSPLECWRLMGIDDECFHIASSVTKNTQLYKQAGNAIVVNVLEGIFKSLFLKDSGEYVEKIDNKCIKK